MATPMEAQPISREMFRQYLGKIGWPVGPNVLAEHAHRHGAPDYVVATLNQLPNRIYMSDRDAWEEYLNAVKPRSGG